MEPLKVKRINLAGEVVKKGTPGGDYLRDSNNIVYNANTCEKIGIWSIEYNMIIININNKDINGEDELYFRDSKNIIYNINNFEEVGIWSTEYDNIIFNTKYQEKIWNKEIENSKDKWFYINENSEIIKNPEFGMRFDIYKVSNDNGHIYKENNTLDNIMEDIGFWDGYKMNKWKTEIFLTRTNPGNLIPVYKEILVKGLFVAPDCNGNCIEMKVRQYEIYSYLFRSHNDELYTVSFPSNINERIHYKYPKISKTTIGKYDKETRKLINNNKKILQYY
jgi:hypothetical protein